MNCSTNELLMASLGCGVTEFAALDGKTRPLGIPTVRTAQSGKAV